LCLDRQAAADFFTFGNSPVLDTYLPHFHPLFNNEVPKYAYDLMAGSALLEEVGWVDHDGDPTTPRVAQGVANVADGTLLEFRYKTTESRQEVATILVESLAECGIHAKVLVYPGSLFFQRGPVGGNWWRDFDMNQFAWGNPPCSLYLAGSIPGPVDEPWISIMDGKERIFSDASGFNMTGFTNQEFDNACNSSLSRLPGQPDYIETQYEVQRIFSEQLPSIPLFSRVLVAATRPDMCNFSLDPTGENLRNIEEFDYGEGCVE
jgi:peptide/nickel transport system substrate-binding protein